MPAIVVCAGCAREWQPTRRDIVRKEWRTCPECRPAAAPRPSGPVEVGGVGRNPRTDGERS